LFGWKGALTEAQTAEIAATKQVIYDGFKAAIAGGVPKEKAGILVDEQFGAAILRDATAHGFTTACPGPKKPRVRRLSPRSRDATRCSWTSLRRPTNRDGKRPLKGER